MLKIGHRGAPSYLPENTISSFKKAVALGMDGIELDVHLSKDGEAVVIHDDTLERTTSGQGKVVEKTFKELKVLDVSGETIPKLEEVFEALGRNIYYFIEIKAPEAALPVAALVNKYIGKGWDIKKLYIISFHHNALAYIGQKFPDIYCGASFEKLQPDSIAVAKNLGAKAIFPQYKTLTPDFIREAHTAQIPVITWTVNEVTDITKLKEMGVDGIIGNYPDRL